MSKLTRRSSRLATWIAVPAAIVAAGVVVSTTSYAAFSDTTSAEGNGWSAGTVQLADDDAGGTLFTATNAKPGDGGANCITVTSTGSLASDVRLYATDAAASAGLDGQLELTIEQGLGGGYGSCDGFAPETTLFAGTLAGFTGSHSSFSDGIAAWSPVGGGSDARTYRVTWKLADAAPNTVQGGTATTSFVWEAQNS